jgi:hypothetical protein
LTRWTESLAKPRRPICGIDDMSYEPSDEEIASVSALSGSERAEYCVKKIIDHDEIWMLVQDEDLAYFGHRGRPSMSVWCAQKWGEAHLDRTDLREIGVRVDMMPASAFIERCETEFAQEKLQIGVCPNPDGYALVIEAPEMAEWLRAELRERNFGLDEVPAEEPEAFVRSLLRSVTRHGPRGKLPG